MAYTKILPISSGSGHVKTAIRYAVRDDKAMFEVRVPDAQGSEVPASIRFASTQLVSSPETAAGEFALTRARFHKTGGRLAYQIIQSFSPDDTHLTPEKVHAIGKAFARRMFPDHEAVIGTHVDRDHIHNHIIVNAVSMRDGHKIHLTNGWIQREMWPVSDEICHEFGVPLLRSRQTVAEQQHPAGRHFRPGSYKETIRRDMAYALSVSETREALINVLKSIGYEIDDSSAHLKIRPQGADRFFRTDRIYADSEFDIVRDWMAETAKELKPLRLAKHEQLEHLPKPTAWQIHFLLYLKILSDQSRRRERTISFDEYRLLPRRLAQFKYILANDIRTPDEVRAASAEADKKLKEVRTQGRVLAKQKRSLKPLVRAVDVLDMLGQTENLSVFQRMKKQNAQQKLSDSGRTADEVRTEADELDDRIAANRKEREECLETATILKEVKALIPRMRQTLRTVVQRASQKRAKPQKAVQKMSAGRAFTKRKPAEKRASGTATPRNTAKERRARRGDER